MKMDKSKLLEHFASFVHADKVCEWMQSDNGSAIVLLSIPNGWVRGGFLIFHGESDPDIVVLRGTDAHSKLPIAIRSKYEPEAVAILSIRLSAESGLLFIWESQSDLPADIMNSAELLMHCAGFATDNEGTSPQAPLRTLGLYSTLDVLPYAIAVIPFGSPKGFVNQPASRLLGIEEGDTQVADISQAIERLAKRAVNPERAREDIRRFLLEKGNAVLSGEVWRFTTAPFAIRFSVVPIGTNPVQGWMWLLEDTGDEERARDLIASGERKFRSFFELLSVGVVRTNPQGRLLEWNAAFEELVSRTVQELSGLTVSELATPVNSDFLSADDQDFIFSPRGRTYEIELTTGSGSRLVAEVSTVGAGGNASEPVTYWSLIKDVTDRKKTEAELAMAAEAFDHHAEAVVVTDLSGRVVTANSAFAQLTGFSMDLIRGKTLIEVHGSKNPPDFFDRIKKQIAELGWWQGEIWGIRMDGDVFLNWLSLYTIRDNIGKPTNIVGVYRDVESIGEAQSRVEHLGTYDNLTSLPNELLFYARLERALQLAREEGTNIAVIRIDLDDFGAINDSYGRTAGDWILQAVADRLGKSVTDKHTVARLGEDEFAILAEGITDVEIGALCETVMSALRGEYRVNEQDLFVTASFGISVFPQDGSDPDTIMSRSGTALVRAKQNGKNAFQVYAEQMSTAVRQQLDIQSGLRKAISRGELRLLYQPQVAIPGNRVIGCEALIRWERDGVTVPPVSFIPIAERSDLIAELTDWVLDEAARQLAVWTKEGLGVPNVSVNISSRHFLRASMPTDVLSIIARYGLNPGQICLEITEGVLIDPKRSESILNQLKESGFLLSIDDFGTGFSSLSYLRRLPVDELKIDKSFIDGITEGTRDRAVMNATIAMAHGCGLKTVAEGVENQDQLRLLLDSGCDIIQGYYFSRPLDPTSFRGFVRSGNHG